MTISIFLIYVLAFGAAALTDIPLMQLFVSSAIVVSGIAFIWTKHQSYLIHVIGLIMLAGSKLIFSSGMFSNQGMSADFASEFLSIVTTSLWVYSAFVLIIATFGALTLHRPESTQV
jgi:hypothetical protein